MWSSLAWGIGVLVAALAPVAWYWRLALFIAVAAGSLWVVVAIYALFLQERLARVRSARRLLREMATEVIAARPAPNAGIDRTAHYGWTLTRAGVFMDAAFDYRVVADYSAWLKIAEDKSKFHNENFRLEEAMAEYFGRLADRLTIGDVDPRFHHPPSFRAFRDQA